MSDATSEAKAELKKGLLRLQTLRDQTRVKLQTASAILNSTLKEQWKKLEPRLGGLEKTASEVSTTARAKVAEAVKKLEKLRHPLRAKTPSS